MTPQDVFIGRLRRYRERSGLSLAEIAIATRIKRELLEAFEQNDLSEWPRGISARAWVRSYARFAGLDPVDTVNEFCRLFPHGDRRAASVIQEMSAIVGHESEYQDDRAKGTERRSSMRTVTPMPPPAWHVAAFQAAQARWTRIRASIRPVRRRGEVAGSLQ